jgi:hypothetical protein
LLRKWKQWNHHVYHYLSNYPSLSLSRYIYIYICMCLVPEKIITLFSLRDFSKNYMESFFSSYLNTDFFFSFWVL